MIVGDLVKSPTDIEAIVVGSEARLHLDGFGRGYPGEGARGIGWLFDLLEIRYTNQDIFGEQEKNVKVFPVPDPGE